jgi:type IV pilus assembly protein PilO
MSFKESLSELKDIDFADLDIQQIGVWPRPLKTILVASIVFLIIGLGYFLKVKDISLATERAVAQEHELLQQ